MWLGVVLHVASVHQVYQSASFWRDPQTSVVADVLIALIHYFRMPVFFIVSGFFAALLVERRGPGGMLAHRALRVGLPFVVFLPILLTVTVVLATMYAQPSSSVPALAFDPHVLPLKRGGMRLQTLHLWFLHLLMGFALVTAILCGLAAKGARSPAPSDQGACSAVWPRAARRFSSWQRRLRSWGGITRHSASSHQRRSAATHRRMGALRALFRLRLRSTPVSRSIAAVIRASSLAQCLRAWAASGSWP